LASFLEKRDGPGGSGKDALRIDGNLFAAPVGQDDGLGDGKGAVFIGQQLQKIAEERDAIADAAVQQIRHHRFKIALVIGRWHRLRFLSRVECSVQIIAPARQTVYTWLGMTQGAGRNIYFWQHWRTVDVWLVRDLRSNRAGNGAERKTAQLPGIFR